MTTLLTWVVQPDPNDPDPFQVGLLQYDIHMLKNGAYKPDT